MARYRFCLALVLAGIHLALWAVESESVESDVSFSVVPLMEVAQGIHGGYGGVEVSILGKEHGFLTEGLAGVFFFREKPWLAGRAGIGYRLRGFRAMLRGHQTPLSDLGSPFPITFLGGSLQLSYQPPAASVMFSNQASLGLVKGRDYLNEQTEEGVFNNRLEASFSLVRELRWKVETKVFFDSHLSLQQPQAIFGLGASLPTTIKLDPAGVFYFLLTPQMTHYNRPANPSEAGVLADFLYSRAGGRLRGNTKVGVRGQLIIFPFQTLWTPVLSDLFLIASGALDGYHLQPKPLEQFEEEAQATFGGGFRAMGFLLAGAQVNWSSRSRWGWSVVITGTPVS